MTNLGQGEKPYVRGINAVFGGERSVYESIACIWAKAKQFEGFEHNTIGYGNQKFIFILISNGMKLII